MTPQQEEKLDKIHDLLAGTLENKGLIHRVYEMDTDVKTLKDYKEKDEKLKNKVAGGVALGVPVLTAAWHWLWNLITGNNH